MGSFSILEKLATLYHRSIPLGWLPRAHCYEPCDDVCMKQNVTYIASNISLVIGTNNFVIKLEQGLWMSCSMPYRYLNL